MSTTFGVLADGFSVNDPHDDEEKFVEIAYRDSKGIYWRNELHFLIPGDTLVFSLDNTDNQIKTMNDLRKQRRKFIEEKIIRHRENLK